MEIERWYETGAGVIGAFFGAASAYFGLKKSISIHSIKIKTLEQGRKDDKMEATKLLEDFKRNIEESVKRIETAHERHIALVVYKDKCATCEELRDSKFESVNGKLDILLDRIKERRKQE